MECYWTWSLPEPSFLVHLLEPAPTAPCSGKATPASSSSTVISGSSLTAQSERSKAKESSASSRAYSHRILPSIRREVTSNYEDIDEVEDSIKDSSVCNWVCFGCSHDRLSLQHGGHFYFVSRDFGFDEIKISKSIKTLKWECQFRVKPAPPSIFWKRCRRRCDKRRIFGIIAKSEQTWTLLSRS